MKIRILRIMTGDKKLTLEESKETILFLCQEVEDRDRRIVEIDKELSSYQLFRRIVERCLPQGGYSNTETVVDRIREKLKRGE